MSPKEDEFLDNLYRRYANQLKLYANSFLKDNARAEEIVQDTFHVATRRVKTLMEHEAPEGWLKKTTKNKILKSEESRRRYIYRFLSLDTDVFIEGSTQKDLVEHQISMTTSPEDEIKHALTKQEYYLLRRIALEKATHKVVAEELGITVWDSQKRLQRIREKLYRIYPERKRKK